MSDNEYKMSMTMSQDAGERLDALCKLTAGSQSEVVANALRLYETMIQDVKAGSIFLVKKPDGSVNTYAVF